MVQIRMLWRWLITIVVVSALNQFLWLRCYAFVSLVYFSLWLMMLFEEMKLQIGQFIQSQVFLICKGKATA